MANFFQDDFHTCKKCDSKEHVIEKVVALDLSTSKASFRYLRAVCANCGKVERLQIKELKE